MIKKAIQYIKKYQNIVIAILLFLISIFIFQFFMGQTVAAAPNKMRTEYIYNSTKTKEIPLPKEGVKQEFSHSGEIYSLTVFVNSYYNTGSLQCSVYNSNDEILTTCQTPLTEIVAGTISFDFTSPIESTEGTFILELIPNNNDTVIIKVGEEDKTIILMAKVEKLGSFIISFYRVLQILVSLSISVVYLLSKRNIPLHKIYLTAAIILGILFTIILPPYSAPDEQFHINEAYTMSSSLLNKIPDEYEELSNSAKFKVNVKRADDINEVLQDRYTTAFSYKELFNGLFSTSKNNQATIFTGDQVGGYALLYIPATIGITIARIFRLSFNMALLLGRLFNLACYIALTSLAVKYTPIKKGLFSVIGLLPMSMHLGSSYSRDVLTIGLYIFFTAYFFYLKFEKENISFKELLVILLTTLIALPAKVIYAPLLLMLLLLPNDKFTFKGKRFRVEAIKTAKIIIVALGLVAFILIAYPQISSSLKTQVVTSDMLPDDIRYTTGYVFTHLKDTVWLTLNTFFSNATFYLNTLVGGWLGYYSIEINWFFILAFFMLLAYTLIPKKDEKYIVNKKTSLYGIVASSITSLLVVFACIVWTPTYFLTIYGIQGRYFLPLLPLLLCTIPQRKSPKILKTQDTDKATIFLAFILSACVLLNAFLVILERV